MFVAVYEEWQCLQVVVLVPIYLALHTLLVGNVGVVESVVACRECVIHTGLRGVLLTTRATAYPQCKKEYKCCVYVLFHVGALVVCYI